MDNMPNLNTYKALMDWAIRRAIASAAASTARSARRTWASSTSRRTQLFGAVRNNRDQKARRRFPSR